MGTPLLTANANPIIPNQDICNQTQKKKKNPTSIIPPNPKQEILSKINIIPSTHSKFLSKINIPTHATPSNQSENAKRKKEKSNLSALQPEIATKTPFFGSKNADKPRFPNCFKQKQNAHKIETTTKKPDSTQD